MFKYPVANFVVLGSLISLFFTFGACSKKEESSSQHPADTQKKVLNVITWEDYVAPEVIEAFTERTGIEVNLSVFADPDELIGTLSAYPDRYDVMIVDNPSLHSFAGMKLLRPLDRDKLSGFSNLDEQFTDLATDPGNRYSVPYLWGSTLVAYRKDKISNPEESFSMLFDPKPELRGKVMMIDDVVDMFGVAHVYQKRSSNSYDDRSLNAAADVLKKQARELGVKFGSDKEVRDGLASGDIWAAMCYSGDAAWVAEDHEEVGYFFPKEGAPLWLDVMAVSRDARNVEEAHAFIDFILDPEIGAMNANSLWYATPNAKAMALLSEELLQDKALFPKKSVLKKCEFLTITPESAVASMARLLREIRQEREVASAGSGEPAE